MKTAILATVSSIVLMIVLSQGGQTLFGDIRVTTEGSNVAVPQEVTLILRRVTEGEVGRQTVSSRGRYRFTNLKTGDYEIVVEVNGEEIGRLQQITVGGLSNSPYGFQYDLDFKLKTPTSRAGVISAADVYSRSPLAEQNFHNYQMLRINECPEIEVIVMKNNYPPEGAGEAGLPPVAPALTNAIFNLCGKRIRELPFNLDKI